MKKTIVLLMFILSNAYAYKAMVVVPYADIIHYEYEPSTTITKEDALSNTLLSPSDNSKDWTRSGQVLFNEVVHVLKERNDHVLISVDQCLTQPNMTLKGWVKKDVLKPLSSFGNTILITESPENSLTLVEPWADQVTNTIYSAGTRFIRNKSKDVEPDFYGVFIYNPVQGSMVESLVPHYAIIINHERSIEEQKELFVATLKKWCLYHLPIKYLFGGMSFTTLQPITPVVHNCSYNGQEHQCFMALEPQTELLTGFDCSGLIFRAATIAGMPYYARNTTAIKSMLKPLTEQHALAVGDLVYKQGHVMVVASLQPAMLIEAIGYKSGYGKVHMIALNKRFKNIETWHDLLSCYFEQKIPIGLYADGSDDSDNYPISFLRLESLWHDAQKT